MSDEKLIFCQNSEWLIKRAASWKKSLWAFAKQTSIIKNVKEFFFLDFFLMSDDFDLGDDVIAVAETVDGNSR